LDQCEALAVERGLLRFKPLKGRERPAPSESTELEMRFQTPEAKKDPGRGWGRRSGVGHLSRRAALTLSDPAEFPTVRLTIPGPNPRLTTGVPALRPSVRRSRARNVSKAVLGRMGNSRLDVLGGNALGARRMLERPFIPSSAILAHEGIISPRAGPRGRKPCFEPLAVRESVYLCIPVRRTSAPVSHERLGPR
jgi:hypothetical protein